ncbi:2-succinyl-5-enolpyruvyl-6-hydroxy-3-cyclohexene-1-carboxylic-acid synthase [Solihabitans fulvus]|uniref:2-succinyl-5-enolpyruvyl-6-hydroxy-3-cyclohexene-1-carboxylate synthase n=1 Tax=Solihabitans fulvus TaxID=1892852 RepID=A0A5B2XLS7_9PSEU|nr:2-succinyl-5-enolpyruvyl-6-hydroxy-3-cyclohexene-1-carboxylic-acid synthase [Solihabitans fulvus]KAA2264818.1 2-succinyl-5-enolpyruvyl-6-hydroxy-3-cyclohexene-1-carboxylic-acid synthase [Solihabitans fulvus]
MNPATAQARVLVDELVRNDVRHVVLCPGSRNAPLSFALHEAAVAGRLTLHVRIDERSAGFLALGLAKGLAHRPHRRGFAAVVCTSGTAVANLHPAVLEAWHGGTALLVLTADRPVELHGTGANQTVEQRGIFGSAAGTVDFPVAERGTGQNAMWRGLVCRAVARADRDRPVHLNLPFREPLVPDGTLDWPEPLDGRPDGARWTEPAGGRVVVGGTPPRDLPPRTLVAVGDCGWTAAHDAAEVAAANGWPVIAEPTGSAGVPDRIGHGSLLLAAGPLPQALRPDAVVVVGRLTLSRGVQRLLREAPVVYAVGDTDGEWVDPQHVVAHATAQLTTANLTADDLRAGRPDLDAGWLAGWRQADDAAGEAVKALLAEQPWPTGLHVASVLVDTLSDGPGYPLLFLGSSNPVRDVDLVTDPGQRITVLANRGVAGIDGSVSTAVGATLGSFAADDRVGPGYALMGDLTFLHDIGGLLIGPQEQRPDLTVVVFNDDGGGIFSLLEQGSEEHAASFERVFGTPHGADLAALCAGYRVPHQEVRSAAELRAALTPTPGLRVVEVRADRAGLRELHQRLRSAVAAAALR